MPSWSGRGSRGERLLKKIRRCTTPRSRSDLDPNGRCWLRWIRGRSSTRPRGSELGTWKIIPSTSTGQGASQRPSRRTDIQHSHFHTFRSDLLLILSILSTRRSSRRHLDNLHSTWPAQHPPVTSPDCSQATLSTLGSLLRAWAWLLESVRPSRHRLRRPLTRNWRNRLSPILPCPITSRISISPTKATTKSHLFTLEIFLPRLQSPHLLLKRDQRPRETWLTTLRRPRFQRPLVSIPSTTRFIPNLLRHKIIPPPPFPGTRRYRQPLSFTRQPLPPPPLPPPLLHRTRFRHLTSFVGPSEFWSKY